MRFCTFSGRLENCVQNEKKRQWEAETTAKIHSQNHTTELVQQKHNHKSGLQISKSNRQKKNAHCNLIVILYLMEYLLDHVSTCSSIIGLLISLLIFHQLVLEFPNYDLR